MNSYFEIQKKQIHSVQNTGKVPLEIIEIQIGSKLNENDIVRIKDKYGRK